MLTPKKVQTAMAESLWDQGNKTLYDLCRRHPRHEDYQQIIAKIWIIGRTYAAAIERRKAEQVVSEEDFYTERVAPGIWNSDIDQWMDTLRPLKAITPETLPLILSVHLKIMALFGDISGLNKRSLASKYLHFHFPHLFYIYDSRAVAALSKLKGYTGRVGHNLYEADNDYRKLFEKCVKLQSCLKQQHNQNLSPRQIDNLLLSFR